MQLQTILISSTALLLLLAAAAEEVSFVCNDIFLFCAITHYLYRNQPVLLPNPSKPSRIYSSLLVYMIQRTMKRAARMTVKMKIVRMIDLQTMKARESPSLKVSAVIPTMRLTKRFVMIFAITFVVIQLMSCVASV